MQYFKEFFSAVYFKKILSVLESPEWLANTGLPLLVTLIGLGAAYTFLRRQLKSDLNLRTADRLQQAASALGFALYTAVEHFELPASDPFWKHNRWPDHEEVEKAVLEARLSLAGKELPELARLVADVDAVWMACMFGAIRAEPPPDTAFHRHAVQVSLRPFLKPLSEYSTALRMWDGLGGIPDARTPPGLLHAPTSDLNDWAKARRTEYEDRLNGRDGISLVKSSGQRLWEASA